METETVLLIARWVLVVSGVVMFLHFVAMNNFITRAPNVIRFVAIPVLAGLAIYMVGCGVLGYVPPGLIAASISTMVMMGVYLTVWAAGFHVSAAFERQARERERAHDRMMGYVRDAADGYEFVADGILTEDIVTDSGLQELQAAVNRANRQGSRA